MGLSFSSKLDWSSVAIAKTGSKKNGALILSIEFLFPKVTLYLYKSTIQPSVDTVVMFWAGAPWCYLEGLDKLRKRIYMTVLSLTASLEPVANCWNITSLSLFYRYYFGGCSSELAQLVRLPWFHFRSIKKLLDHR